MLSKTLSVFLLLLFSTSLSLALPTENHYTHRRPSNNTTEVGQLRRDVPEELENRAVIPTIAGILSIAVSVKSLLDDLFDDLNKKQRDYVQRTVDNLAQQYPDYNVLVYHNQDSGYSFYNAAHAHDELELVLGTTKGYELWVFERGSFDLEGDGGYENWGFSGCFVQNGDKVEFYSVDNCRGA